MTTRPDVLVVGAGIIGLTTAIAFAESGRRVHIRAAKPPRRTTSAAAGALWGPWLVQPRARVLPWAEHSLAVLRHLATLPGTGVRIATGIEASNTVHAPHDWIHLLYEPRPCEPDELPDGYRYGTRYAAPLIDMPVHLEYLIQRFEVAGGTIQMEPVADLTDVGADAPTIVNCTGLGARTLTPDESLYPIRGQHLVVTNPGLTDFIEVDTDHPTELVAIYPHGGHVVLGGSAEPNQWDLEPDPATAAGILARCLKIEPRLHTAKILDHRVGLRPTRPTVRLDIAQHDGVQIVHNYGHGGAGVSLAWGCAADAVSISS